MSYIIEKYSKITYILFNINKNLKSLKVEKKLI